MTFLDFFGAVWMQNIWCAFGVKPPFSNSSCSHFEIIIWTFLFPRATPSLFELILQLIFKKPLELIQSGYITSKYKSNPYCIEGFTYDWIYENGVNNLLRITHIDLSRIPLQCVRTIALEWGWGGRFHTFTVFLSTPTSTRCHCLLECGKGLFHFDFTSPKGSLQAM